MYVSSLWWLLNTNFSVELVLTRYVLLTVRWDIYPRLMRGGARRGKHAHMREQRVNEAWSSFLV